MAEDKIVSVTFEESGPARSQQEIEQELIDAEAAEGANGEGEGEAAPEAEVEANTDTEALEAALLEQENNVLSFLREKSGREDLTFENLFEPKTVETVVEKERELSPEMAAFEKYKAETGRGLNDFMKINRDLSSESDDAIIAEYIQLKNPSFDSSDAAFEMKRSFGFDEDDEEDEKRAKQIEKKKIAGEARLFISEQQEKYKAPLESSEGFIPQDQRDVFEQFQVRQQEEAKIQEESKAVAQYFSQKTNEHFSDTFKGFEFKVGEENVMFEVKDVKAVKERQLDGRNFLKRHLDDKNMLKDAGKYHKEMFAATHGDEIANFFYEKGMADQVEKAAKEAKNIDMGTRSTKTFTTEGGTKVSYEDGIAQKESGSGIKKRYT